MSHHHQQPIIILDDSSSSSSSNDTITPRQSSRKPPSARQLQKNTTASESDNDIITPHIRRKRKAQANHTAQKTPGSSGKKTPAPSHDVSMNSTHSPHFSHFSGSGAPQESKSPLETPTAALSTSGIIDLDKDEPSSVNQKSFHQTLSSTYSSRMYLPLKYQRAILKDLSSVEHENALLIGDKGLGLQENILVAFLKHFAVEKNHLVLVLNATTRQSEFIEMEINQVAFSKRNLNGQNGSKNGDLQRVRNVKSLSSLERKREYCSGRVIFISSNVLVMDFLQNNIPAQMVSGLVVLNAHEVSDLSYEAMALRLYRERNHTGFVKGLTDSPVGALRATGRTKRLSIADSGITKNVDKVMSLLCLNHVFLWPSFDATIRESLGKEPTVYELEISMTSRMKRIQTEILRLITLVLNDVGKIHPDLDFGEDRTTTFLLNLENVIKSQLKPQWNRIDRHTKIYIEELQELRRLALFLTQYDSVVYHNYLQTIRSNNLGGGTPKSHWVLTDEAAVMFECARQRVYTQTTQIKKKKQKTMTQIVAKEVVRTKQEMKMKLQLEALPKWTNMESILTEIQAILQKNEHRSDLSNRVLIQTKNEKTMSQIRSVLQKGSKNYLKQTAKRLVRVSSRANIKQLFGKKDNGRDAENRSAPSTTTKGSAKRGTKRKKSPKKKLGVETEEDIQSVKTLLSEEGATESDEAQDQDDTNQLDESLSMEHEELLTDATQAAAPLSVTSARAQTEFNDYFGLFDRSVLGEGLSTPETPVLDISVATAYNAFNMLDFFRPSFIIMYDADLEFMRRVEVFHAENPGVPLHVYLLRYVGSAEEELYTAECDRTRSAFVELIKTSGKLLSVSKTLGTLLAENRPQLEEEIQRDSRVAGGRFEQVKKGKIVVDSREFRSMLPIRLDHMGIDVIPKQLSVGDYILTKKLCVERKAISDLIQSLNSGRLLNQAENMTKNYPIAALLIQFENHEPFFLSDEYSDVSLNLPTAKLVLLTIQFPHLKVFWSRSSADSAELFQELKKYQEDPDENTIEESDAADEEREKAEKAVKLLMQLPGITEINVHKVKDRVTNLQELVQLSQEELRSLLGKKNGETLYEFINK